MGCIVRVAESIARLDIAEHEKEFIDALTRSLHIPDDAEKSERAFARLVLSMMTHEVFYKTDDDAAAIEDKDKDKIEETLKSEAINYHGACLLKSCLSFEKCSLVANSFLTLSRDELACVACHASGNFAFESFLNNKNIKQKLKNKLSDRLCGKFAVLASDKFGSRVIDALWQVVGQESKDRLKTELTQNKAKLESDLYGRIVLCNCEINQKAKKMREIREQQERKRKLFKDILEKGQDADNEKAELPPPVKKTKNKSKFPFSKNSRIEWSPFMSTLLHENFAA